MERLMFPVVVQLKTEITKQKCVETKKVVSLSLLFLLFFIALGSKNPKG